MKAGLRMLAALSWLTAAQAPAQSAALRAMERASVPLGFATFVVPAAPERGFSFPYILKVPQPAGDTLLVLPNNTGMPSDEFEVHLRAALRAVERAPGALAARRLFLSALVPVFPRPASRRNVYTHALDRDTMEITSGELARLDLQLLAMIDDALSTLRARGIALRSEIAMVGFSASGTFANRFAFLHPDRVAVVVAGGVNGLPMLPRAELGGVALPYPLGLADFATLTGGVFDRERWSRIPQLIFMGAEDTNDTLPYSDAFSEAEKDIIRAVIGKRMQPYRWQTCQAVYASQDTRAAFRTYAGIGHGTDAAVNAEIVEFVRGALDAGRANEETRMESRAR